MAAGSANNVYLHLSLEEAAPSSEADLTVGRVEVRFPDASFHNFRRSIMNPDGFLDPFDYPMMSPDPTTSTFAIEVPANLFPYPDQHRHYLQTQISSNLIDLIGIENPNRHDVARNIASLAMRYFEAGAEARGSWPGYSIVAEVHMLQSEVYFDETLDEADRESEIEKLIEKGKFVVSEDDELGTCGICIEDFSSSDVGAELLHMDCCHIYHLHCILPWFSKSNTCPTCRAKLF